MTQGLSELPLSSNNLGHQSCDSRIIRPTAVVEQFRTPLLWLKYYQNYRCRRTIYDTSPVTQGLPELPLSSNNLGHQSCDSSIIRTTAVVEQFRTPVLWLKNYQNYRCRRTILDTSPVTQGLSELPLSSSNLGHQSCDSRIIRITAVVEQFRTPGLRLKHYQNYRCRRTI